MVADLQKRRKVVAMIGDRTNAAPVLAQADLGIAMGCGSELAKHGASVVRMRSRPSYLLDIPDPSRKTARIVRQDLFCAIFAALLNPIRAALAMIVSSLPVIANSSRISRAHSH